MTEGLDYLDDILESVEKVWRFTQGMSYDEFVDDPKTVDAALRTFEVIGEAAKNVPDDVRKAYSDVPWSEMAGMRDKLIHGYATVEVQVLGDHSGGDTGVADTDRVSSRRTRVTGRMLSINAL